MSTNELDFRAAIREAIVEEMERDESVVFFGEDIAAEQGGVFAVTPGIQERFGAERVFDTPISELAITGAAFGAAVTGLRPIIEIMFGDFMGLSMDSLVNQAAKSMRLAATSAIPFTLRTRDHASVEDERRPGDKCGRGGRPVPRERLAVAHVLG